MIMHVILNNKTVLETLQYYQYLTSEWLWFKVFLFRNFSEIVFMALSVWSCYSGIQFFQVKDFKSANIFISFHWGSHPAVNMRTKAILPNDGFPFEKDSGK